MLRIVRERRCEDARAPCFGSFRKGCDASLLDFQAQLCVLTVNPCRFSGDGARNRTVKKREFCGGRFRSGNISIDPHANSEDGQFAVNGSHAGSHVKQQAWRG